MPTATYANDQGVLLSLASSTTPHKFWAAAPGQTTTAIGGGHTLYADGFDDNFYIYTATDQVVVPPGTTGTDTVFDDAYNASYTLANGVQNLVLSGNNQVGIGNDLDNLIIAQSGTATMSGGGGDDVFVCGTGPDTILDPAGSGSDVIYGFKNGTDHVSLAGSGFTSFAQVQAALQQVGGDALLDLGNGQTLTFRDTQATNFVASDFYLPVNTAGLTLTFDDEFNNLNASATGIGTLWRSTMGHGARTLAANHEAEYYSDSSVGVSPFAVNNGTLDITAAPTDPSTNSLGLPYTSGVVTTEKSFAQLYGYFEMRAELPTGQGFWPAFWLLPANGTWPPEIDAMEQIGSQPNQDVVSAHFVNDGQRTIVSSCVNVGNTTQGFHTYGVYWGPDVIRWYFDGQEIATAATPADMNTPMYMTVNLAVGGTGSWPGATVPGSSATMQVDYVRAYAYVPGGLTAVADIATTNSNAVAATPILSSTTLDFGVVHVGSSDTQMLNVSNGGAGPSSLLLGGFRTVTQPFTASGTMANGLAGGGSTALAITLHATQAEVTDGAAFLALNCGGTAVATPQITLLGTIDNYATASIAPIGGTASVTGGDGNYIIDLGSIDAQASTGINLAVLNAASGVADALAGGFRIYNAAGFQNTGFTAFAGVQAGQADTAPTVTLSSQFAGVFSETIILSPSGTNASGYYGALPTQTIIVTGTVLPIYQLGSAQTQIGGGSGNDTIIANGGSLAAGDVINGGGGDNTLVLSSGGTYDLSAIHGFSGIQTITAQESIGAGMQTVTLRNYANLTVNVLPDTDGIGGIIINAGTNNDTINLGSGNDVVYVNSAGQTVNGGGNDTVYAAANRLGATLNGGGAGSELVLTSGGKAVLGGKITGFGTLALGGGATQLQANDIAGLDIIGSATGGDTITLGAASQSVSGGGPGEHVLATASLAGAAVNGLGANSTLEITTGGTATLNDATGGSAAAALTVQLDQATHLALSAMSFIDAVGSSGADTIIAGAGRQVLTGGAGADTLVGYSAGGDIFRDSSAGLNGDTIQGLCATDQIDLTDMAFAPAHLQYNTTASMLTVNDGYHAAAITLTGAFDPSGFSIGNDGHGGSLVLYHAP